TSRLSVVVNFPCARRKYDTSVETRGSNSCETVADTSQLLRRWSNPVIVSGSKCVAMLTLPKLVLVNAPSSDSCGMPSRLASLFHVRVAELTDVLSGFSARAWPTVDVWT